MLSVVVVMSIVALIVSGVTLAFAQSDSYTLDWFSIDTGGGQAIGGAYTLNGAIGQADVGMLSGGRNNTIRPFANSSLTGEMIA